MSAFGCIIRYISLAMISFSTGLYIQSPNRNYMSQYSTPEYCNEKI